MVAEPTDRILEALHAVGQAEDAAIPLADTALRLAALDHVGIDLAPYRDHLTQVAEQARDSMASLRRGMSELEAAARVLADTIGVRHGYMGDSATFDDPQNADLIRVIDRKRGLPVSLGIVYIDIAHRLEIPACGLNTPGHFLLALGQGEHARIIDPFNGGVILSAEELRPWPQVPESEAPDYGPVGRRDVLLRLLNNIHSRALASQDKVRTLTIVERMVLIAPRHPDLWLELSKACEAVDKMNGAIRAAQNCISLAGDQSPLGRQAAFVLQGLKRRVN
ncbi:MAG: transglutaminase family protein [Alphaproteobacteria bacterium]|nr:transglutaminase family protein [Alphaproteobacteria bacterium]